VEPLRNHSGTIAVVPGDHIDTDRIIPARFLSRVSRFGYGELLFADVRSADFALDKPEAAGATILVVGLNFGCGSSREHAVWAIQQAGFRAVIARRTADSPGFSDIFRSNAANCGLLLIELSEDAHGFLSGLGSGAGCSIDLAAQTVGAGGITFEFEIAASQKEAILEGRDLIGSTLVYQHEISAFEAKHNAFTPVHRS
jgi:3-isopropylmalate/(R)-2-methylmalate dehydratase small subunit